MVDLDTADPGSASREGHGPGSSVDPFAGARIRRRRRRTGRRRFGVAAACVVIAVAVAAWIDEPPADHDPTASQNLTTVTPPADLPDEPAEPAEPHESLSPEVAAELMRTGDRRDAASTAPAEQTVIDEPVRVEVPAIDVDADLIGVGLNPDGSMAVPDFGLAGWYTKGPAPGAPGPSVIAAHVDSRDGPDVFFRLHELEPGDEIHVHGADGETATWEMYASQLTDKDELPADRIWNDTDQPALRLITCGGAFDHTARSYESNVIVYAAPVDG